MSAAYDLKFKVVLAGDSGVGKTSLLLRFAEDEFSESAPENVDFKEKIVRVDGKRVLVEVYDTAGQERYRTLTTKYFRDALGVLIVYDISNEETFKKSLRQWVSHIERYGPMDITQILIGNKVDLESEGNRQVDSDDAREFANNYKMGFMETSAKKATNVDKAFETLVRSILKKNKGLGPSPGPALPEKSGGCC